MIPLHHMDESGLVVTTGNPSFASDHAQRIVLWNRGAENLLGFAAGEMIGTPYHELIGCIHRVRCSGPCSDSLGGDPAAVAPSFDRQIRRKSGATIWVNVTTIVAAPRDGSPMLVHLLRDLTRQKEMEELLRQLVSRAAKLSFNPSAANDDPASPRAPVTAREREVIRLLAWGTSTEAIAANLSITPRTARNHIQNVFTKLGVHSRLEAVAYATSKGLL